MTAPAASGDPPLSRRGRNRSFGLARGDGPAGQGLRAPRGGPDSLERPLVSPGGRGFLKIQS